MVGLLCGRPIQLRAESDGHFIEMQAQGAVMKHWRAFVGLLDGALLLTLVRRPRRVRASPLEPTDTPLTMLIRILLDL